MRSLLMFGERLLWRLDRDSVNSGPCPWWAGLPESRLTIQACALPGLEGHQAFVVEGMHIQCELPGNIRASP